jgi:flagellar biosynthesis GTPase FlhF
MKLFPFIAENAAAALAQVEERLGPDAIIVSVRKLPSHGISRLWNRSGQIEVLACVPEDESAVQSSKFKVHAVPPGVDAYVPFAREIESGDGNSSAHHWPSISWLESLGLMKEFADELEKKVSAIHGEAPPPMPIAEWHAVRDCLASFWRPARQNMECTGRPHVFIGPAGSGKTTVLCKWMTLAVLMQERNVQVWRLDGNAANTAEFFSLHCEMLGLRAERLWSPPTSAADLFFVDLPGVESRDTHSLTSLREQLSALPQPHVHLVLNATCETRILFEQLHAFAPLAPEDIIFTHLDEEQHRVKLWNFVLGQNFPISFLSAGQKIPGEFCRAESGLLFPRQKPNK